MKMAILICITVLFVTVEICNTVKEINNKCVIKTKNIDINDVEGLINKLTNKDTKNTDDE